MAETKNKDMDRSREMARLALKALEDKKAENIQILDISDVSVLADFFLIATGKNVRQLEALMDAVEEKLTRAGFPVKNIEGVGNDAWILMDFGDVIVHIFDEEHRIFYDLERIWRDGKHVTSEDLC